MNCFVGIRAGAVAAALCGLLIAHAGCGDDAPDPAAKLEAAVTVIDWRRMRDTVDFLADDALGGRVPGSPGHLKARDHLVAAVTELGLQPAGDDGTFLHTYPATARDDRFQLNSDGSVGKATPIDAYNIVARLPGRDDALAHEHLVVMAHYDHLGVDEQGAVFNGAFDNAGGVAVALELARAFLDEGAVPRRSILFLFTDEEEGGLNGARAWITAPTIPKENVVMGISADPVGRNMLPDYGPIILSGLERSPALLDAFRETEVFTERDIVYAHRMMIPVFGSDQDPFHDAGVPAAWFVTPGMSFYHTLNDTADTLDYRLVRDAARYLARVLHHFGESEARYTYVGAPDLAPVHASDIKRIIDGLSGSAIITADHRAKLMGYADELQSVIDEGTWDALARPPLAFFFEAVGFAAFGLPAEIPGDVPPPTPTD